MAPGNRDRGRVDDMALDPALDKQAMNPKTVQSSLLNDQNLYRDAAALLGFRFQARKKDEHRSAVTARNDMLGNLLLARTVGGPQPLRLAQFERGEQRVRVIADGGLDSGCGGLGLHRGLHAGVWKLSLPTQPTVHPHRIFFRTTTGPPARRTRSLRGATSAPRRAGPRSPGCASCRCPSRPNRPPSGPASTTRTAGPTRRAVTAPRR